MAFVEELSLRSPSVDKAAMARAMGDAHLSQILTQKKMTFSLPWSRWLPCLARCDEPVGCGHLWNGLVDPQVAGCLLEDPTEAQVPRRLALLVLGHWLQHLDEPRRISKRRV